MAKLFGLTADQVQRIARVADAVERQPLRSTTGKRLSHRRSSPPPVILAEITGNSSANDYTAKSIRGDVASTGTYLDTDFGDALADENDIIARDRAQIGGSTARPLTGLIIAGKVIGRDSNGKRIVEFSSALQKIRANATSLKLEGTYLPNPSGDSDWVEMAEGYDCDS